MDQTSMSGINRAPSSGLPDHEPKLDRFGRAIAGISPMSVLLMDPNIEGRAGEPPLNLALLKAYIAERTSHKAGIIDFTFQKKAWKSALVRRLEEEPPDLIGISAMSLNFSQALEVAEFIKSRSDIPIIFGGVHAILEPEEVIARDCADFVCTGEGEYILQALLDKALDPKGVRGIWYKTGEGEVIRNERQPVIEDLDSLPFPDWDDFELEKYFRINIGHMPLMCSRGCPFVCTYCNAAALRKALGWKKVRTRSIAPIMEEIGRCLEKYAPRGFKYIQFNDDTFILDEDFVMEFCRAYKAHGFYKKVIWAANVRADLLTENIVKAMKDAGCYEMGLGIESVDDFVRREVYRRNMSLAQIDRAVALVKKHGLQLHIPIIIGSPYDTMEIMERNLAYAKKTGAECILFPALMPLPGTEIRKVCEAEGLLEESSFRRPHIMHTQPVIRTKFASRRQVAGMMKKVRLFLIRKYLLEGLRRKGLIFLKDLAAFLIYYKPKFGLEIDNAWKFTLNRYNLEKFRKERQILGP